MATLNDEAKVEKEEEVSSTVDGVTTTAGISAPVEPSFGKDASEPEKCVKTEAGSSSSKEDEVLKTALNSLFQGKRHLLVKDLAHAISSLGEACRLLGEVKGTPTSESGEAHFYYGKALLELARNELSVIDAPGGEVSGEDEEEEEEGDEEEEEQDEEGADATEAKAAEAEVLNGEKEVATEEDISTPSPQVELDSEAIPAPVTNGNEHATNGSVVDDEKPSTSAGLDESAADKENEDEPSNLELAWEVLEVAKLTYVSLLERAHLDLANALEGKDGKKTALDYTKIQRGLQDRLASTHLLLGEVATEGEQYNAAEEDFKTALNIYRDIEPADSRKIAQSYFQLGIAYSFDKKFVEAIISFEKAAELIELRLSNLSALIQNKDSEEYKSADQPELEIEELEQLLPEMKEKIADTKDAQRDSLKTQEEEKQEQEIILRNSPIKNPNAPVAKDISHLVRKKKKADDETHEQEPPRKKVCADSAEASAPMESNEPDSSVAVASATNGTSNGHAVLEDGAPTSTTASE